MLLIFNTLIFYVCGCGTAQMGLSKIKQLKNSRITPLLCNSIPKWNHSAANKYNSCHDSFSGKSVSDGIVSGCRAGEGILKKPIPSSLKTFSSSGVLTPRILRGSVTP